jgi:hypothetical protein
MVLLPGDLEQHGRVESMVAIVESLLLVASAVVGVAEFLLEGKE